MADDFAELRQELDQLSIEELEANRRELNTEVTNHNREVRRLKHGLLRDRVEARRNEAMEDLISVEAAITRKKPTRR